MALLRDEQSGFGFPMIAKGMRGPLNYVKNDTVELIKASIRQILLTVPGERMMNPEFGCKLRLMHFETLTATLQTTIQNLILEALERWEPRIEVSPNDIVVKESASIASDLEVKVSFKVKNPDFTATVDTAVYLTI